MKAEVEIKAESNQTFFISASAFFALAGFLSILLKHEVEAGRQAMAERIKLSQWILGRTARAVKRHSPVYCMVPPDTIA